MPQGIGSANALANLSSWRSAWIPTRKADNHEGCCSTCGKHFKGQLALSQKEIQTMSKVILVGSVPAIVKYVEFDKEFFALPIGAKAMPHHLGENDEPLLDLVIVQPVLDPLDPKHEKTISLVGTSRQLENVRIVNDVPHDSHAFSDASLNDLQKQGISTGVAYPGNRIPGGRWFEVSSAELAALMGEANEREKALEEKKAAAEKAKQEAEEAEKADTAAEAEASTTVQ